MLYISIKRDRQTDRHRQRQTDRQRYRNRQIDRDRQTETQRHRQTDRQTETQTEVVLLPSGYMCCRRCDDGAKISALLTVLFAVSV